MHHASAQPTRGRTSVIRTSVFRQRAKLAQFNSGPKAGSPHAERRQDKTQGGIKPRRDGAPIGLLLVNRHACPLSDSSNAQPSCNAEVRVSRKLVRVSSNFFLHFAYPHKIAERRQSARPILDNRDLRARPPRSKINHAAPPQDADCFGTLRGPRARCCGAHAVRPSAGFDAFSPCCTAKNNETCEGAVG